MSQSGVRRVLTPRPVAVYTAPELFFSTLWGLPTPRGLWSPKNKDDHELDNQEL